MPHAKHALPREVRTLFGWTALAALAVSLGTLRDFGTAHALMLNASPSLPYWAIWLERGATPKRGDILLFDPPASPLLQRHFGVQPHPFGKRVMGISGDIVTRHGRMFFVNGKAVAMAKTTSRLGEPLAAGPTGILPPGCFFVATPHKDGFDSRYAAIGWICRDQVLGVGRPIL
jgi:conjugal transfer pilin signal peptidase TrbI